MKIKERLDKVTLTEELNKLKEKIQPCIDQLHDPVGKFNDAAKSIKNTSDEAKDLLLSLSKRKRMMSYFSLIATKGYIERGIATSSMLQPTSLIR